MKKLLLLLLFPLLFSCTNYYYVTLETATPLYDNSSVDGTAIITIPANEKIYVKGKKIKRLRKIKYNNYTGWAIYPSYNNYYSENTSSPSSYRSNSRSYSTPSSSSSKTVKVKGYTRKDGTYVRPHTRSAPRRH